MNAPDSVLRTMNPEDARPLRDRVLDALGRLAVATLFIDAARYHLTSGWGVTLSRMQARGVPLPKVLLVLAMVVSSVLALGLVLGIKERWAALGLALYAISVSFVMYDPLGHPTVISLILFLKDLCIFGALLSLSRSLGSSGWLRR